MFFPIHAHMRIVKATITTSQTNLDLKTWLVANTLWDGVTPVSLEVVINPGVILGASNTSNRGLTISDFPAGCNLILTNNGRIQGAGGAGGKGAVNGVTAAVVGGAGGTALYARSPVTVINNNQIWGGGGGGGGGGYWHHSLSNTGVGGSGGGGGAGTVAGGGGAAGNTNANAGSAGSATAGGSSTQKCFPVYWDEDGHSASETICSRAGGAGGGPGLAGASGTGPGGNSGGGAAGRYVDGNTHVTWAVTGDRRGAVA